MTNDEKLKVLKYLYPDAPRRLVDGILIVGTVDGMVGSPQIDLSTIDFVAKLAEIELEEAKILKKKEIIAAHDQALEDGMPYDFNGVSEIVQIRLKDQTVLLGLSITASKEYQEGVTDATFDFRVKSNIEYEMTPLETYIMTEAAYSYVKALYRTSWTLKDTLSALSYANGDTIADVNAINWPT